ncbi:MAG: thiamine phosphate synthase [Pyrinomonadaceae bacterium]|nr:thiamine phosphate synthase [Pyrinomonadaceae bacterium]
MRVNLPKIYPITDRRISGLSHAAQVERLCAGGATFIQLREKHLSPREFYREAVEALEVARSHNARLIINDRADIALALRADGVHFGQDDLPPEAARALLGEDFIIGYSTHNIEQAVAVAKLPINYIAIGPIFSTASKENPDPIVGLDGLRRVRAELGESVPLVAIGGINFTNARNVISSGASAIAIISYLLEEPSQISARTESLVAEVLNA